MTQEQLDGFFEEACVTWLVEPKRILKLREAWESRFGDLDAQTFNFALRRAEERHTRYLPTIPQILEIYREVDRQATSREKSNRLLDERRDDGDRELTPSECQAYALEFAQTAARIRGEHPRRPRHAEWVAWYEQLAEYYQRQAPRVARGERIETPPRLTDLVALVGGGKSDPHVERQREARTRRIEDVAEGHVL